MKKNLSSKAIKAMAIGMAVTLGSTTAISGVINSVTVKAENVRETKIDDKTAPTTITNTGTTVDNSSNKHLISSSGLSFEILTSGTANSDLETAKGTAGTAKLTKRAEVPTLNDADGTQSKPYGATIENGLVIVNTNSQYYVFKIEEIGDGTDPIAKDSLSDLSNVNVSNLISDNLKKIANNAFKGITISENLTISTANNSNLQIGERILNSATINGNLKIGGTNKITPNTGKKIFKNLTVNGDLDLSELNINGVTNLSDLGLGSLDNEITSGDNAVIVTGQLLLPKFGMTVDNASLKHINVGKIDLSNIYTNETLPTGLFDGSIIGELILDNNTKNIEYNTFEGATLTNFNFSNIKSISWYAFNNATINNNLDLSGKNINKDTLNKITIKGNLNLSNAKFENSNKGILQNANISGDLDLSNTNIPATTDTTGIFGGVKVGGNINLTGVKSIPTNAFKNATLPSNIELTDVTNIDENAFGDLANTDKVTINLPKYTKDTVTIDPTAFGTTTKVDLILPFGTSNQDAKDLQSKINEKNTNVTVIVEQAKINGYVFEQGNVGEVTLVSYTAPITKQTTENSFVNGTLTYNDETYTLTKVGNGTDSLSTITNDALNGHTSKVTEVAASAFENNENITTAEFPVVTTIGARAFANTKITTAKLGIDTQDAITIASDAFDKVSTLKKVETNTQSKDVVKTAVKNSGATNITLSAGGSTEIVNPNNSSSGGGSSSSGGSSSGSGFTGGGANIGNTDATTENTTSNVNNNNNNNNNTTVTIENKELTLDVINLPSVTGEAKVFSDVSASHWAKSYIDKLSTAGVINGSNGMFNPNGQTKRADATVMLVNLLGLQPEANNRFADVVSTAYYAPYVGTASTYGIVNGSNGMFNPNNTISRQDTMVMMAQILKALDLNVNTDTSVLNQFSDVNSVSSYATESVAILVNSGIISGNNGKLNPISPVTRAEMATIMSKLYDVLESATK